MARTLVGHLVLRLIANGFKEGARKAVSSLDQIENRAKRMGSGPGWGSNFQRRLDGLQLTPAQLAAVKESWGRLPNAIDGALNKRDVVAHWKNGVLMHFADVETRSKRLATTLKETFSGPVMASLLGYGTYAVGREAVEAGAQRDRALFRMEQAGVPENERGRILDSAEELSAKYPGMSMTEITELALRARSTMGDIDRTLGILEGLVQGQVVLMSAFGPQSGDNLMSRIVKAGDVLGQNEEGPEGIRNMLQIIDGLVRAGQVEGSDFDPGSILEFARRGKVAGAGWSTEFLSTVAPVLIQDQGGPQAGNALAMAFKSFVLGDNSMNGKVYRERQAELGLRSAPGADLEGAELMTANPFAWVRDYLRPALEEAGVNMEDEGEITRAVGRLSGNSNATAAFTRMLTQYEQIMKSLELYESSMGIDAAEQVGTRDPFVAWEGFKNSFSNFSGAIAENAEIITPGLNKITGAINQFAASVRDDPARALGLGGVGAGLVGVGAWKFTTGIMALVGAGPQLQTAATMLQAAATSLKGGSSSGGQLGDRPNNQPGGRQLRGLDFLLQGLLGLERPEVFPLGPMNRPATEAPAVAEPGPYDHLMDDGIGWSGMAPAPEIDTGPLQTADGVADAVKTKLTEIGALVVAPAFNMTPLSRMVALLERAVALQQQLGSAPGGSTATDLGARVRASYSDYGVTP